MVQDMNEKGRWSALGGLFAVARAAAATARKVYERLSYLSRLLPPSLSLSRISVVAVSKLFLRPVVKGWPRACTEIITRSITDPSEVCRSEKIGSISLFSSENIWNEKLVPSFL